MKNSYLKEHKSLKHNIRPMDSRRDLNGIADLIELCFARTLDADGRQYLQNLRMAACNPGPFEWLNNDEKPSIPPGFVWVENGKVIGNLTLIPHFLSAFSQRERRYLIANVAVHPDYRRRGIAKNLTSTAVASVLDHSQPSPWLHVRDDNPTAYDLYQSLGFVEHFRRTTWHTSSDIPFLESTKEFSIVPHKNAHWKNHRKWFMETYPPMMTWFLPINESLLRPGLLSFFLRLFRDVYLRQWAAQADGEVSGVISWQPTHGHSDILWLTVDPQKEDDVIPPLFACIYDHFDSQRMLSLDYPYQRAVQTLQQVGLTQHHTLIWMQYKSQSGQIMPGFR